MVLRYRAGSFKQIKTFMIKIVFLKSEKPYTKTQNIKRYQTGSFAADGDL